MVMLPCGYGKTLILLWIAKKLGINTIVIGVPNMLLFSHWKTHIGNFFPDYSCLIVSKCISTENITQFMTDHASNCIVMTTYASANKVNEAAQYSSFTFGMKINDDVRYLPPNTQKYAKILDIPSVKQLSLTTTQSNCEIDFFGKMIWRHSSKKSS